MKKNKEKFIGYKKYNVDIGGFLKNNLLNYEYIYKNFKKSKLGVFKLNSFYPYLSKFNTRIIKYFFFRYFINLEKKSKKNLRFTYSLINKDIKLKKFKKYKHLYTLHLTFLFYINLTFKNFKKIAIKAKKSDGFFEENFFYFLENRLVCAIYRSAMISNMFDAITFVKKGCIRINNKIVPYINYVVPIMKIINIRPILKGFLIGNFWRKIIKKNILLNMPNYIYFFYTFFFFFYKRMPKKMDFINPFNLDMFRALGYIGYAK